MTRITRQSIKARRERTDTLRADRLTLDLARCLPDDDLGLEAVATEIAQSIIRQDVAGRVVLDKELDAIVKRLTGLACALSETGNRWADCVMDMQDSLSLRESGGGGGDGGGAPQPLTPNLPPRMRAHAERVVAREQDRREFYWHALHRTKTPHGANEMVDDMLAERDAEIEQTSREVLVRTGQGEYTREWWA